MAEYIDSITLSKLRGINILVVADALGIACVIAMRSVSVITILIRACISGHQPILAIALHAGGVVIISTW